MKARWRLVAPLVAGAAGCMAIGGVMVLKPVAFGMSGGLNRYSHPDHFSVIPEGASRFLGVGVVGFGVFLLLVVRRLWRDAKRGRRTRQDRETDG